MKKPRGLVRFSSQSQMVGGGSRWLRPRVVIYPVIMTVLLTTFVVVLAGKGTSDVTLLRGFGQPYTMLKPGEVTNQLRVKIRNRGTEKASYDITVGGDNETRLSLINEEFPVPAGESRTDVILLTAPQSAFEHGMREVTLRITDGKEFTKELNWRLLGPRGRAVLQGAYHGARLLTYTAVGLVCGLLGAGLNWGSSFFGLQRAAALVVGCMMVAIGLVGILRYVGVRWSPLRAGAAVQRWVVAGQRAALGMRALPRAALVGLLTAFLPCGWLYLFAIAAAGTGSPLWGGAVMAAFWLGTVPVLSLVGISVQTLTGVVGQRLPLVTSLVIMVLGLYTAYGRLTIPVEAFERSAANSAARNGSATNGSATNGSATNGSAATAEERVEAALRQEPPCCYHESQ